MHFIHTVNLKITFCYKNKRLILKHILTKMFYILLKKKDNLF